MTTVLSLALDVMAAKRLTRLAVEDAIADEVREKVWDQFPRNQSKLGYLISCHACSSVWAAAIVRSGFLPRLVRDTLAVSELVLVAQRFIDDAGKG
ncbi:MAG TPA: DUF1360 domain-containing protein [Nocardioidaceae bacterium]|nr:DUF1360 domain-containing protein [Nocardioidaceae bacterium]